MMTDLPMRAARGPKSSDLMIETSAKIYFSFMSWPPISWLKLPGVTLRFGDELLSLGERALEGGESKKLLT